MAAGNGALHETDSNVATLKPKQQLSTEERIQRLEQAREEDRALLQTYAEELRRLRSRIEAKTERKRHTGDLKPAG